MADDKIEHIEPPEPEKQMAEVVSSEELPSRAARVYDTLFGTLTKKLVATGAVLALGAAGYLGFRPSAKPEPPCTPEHVAAVVLQGEQANKDKLATLPDNKDGTKALTLQIVRDAVSLNELGSTTPTPEKIYHLSNAGLGGGYSIGITQSDLAVHYSDKDKDNDPVRKTFLTILQKTKDISGLSDTDITAIMTASQQTGTSDVIEKYKDQINKALNSDFGKQQIDTLDNAQFLDIANRLTRTMDYIKQHRPDRDAGILEPSQYGSLENLRALALMAMGNNQLGAGVIGNDGALIDTMDHLDHPPTAQDFRDFFQSQPFFRQNPDNFNNFMQKAGIAAGKNRIESIQALTQDGQHDFKSPDCHVVPTPSVSPPDTTSPSATATASPSGTSPSPSTPSTPFPSPSAKADPDFYIMLETHDRKSLGKHVAGTSETGDYIKSVSDTNNLYIVSPDVVSANTAQHILGQANLDSGKVGNVLFQTVNGTGGWTPAELDAVATLSKGHTTPITIADANEGHFVTFKNGGIIQEFGKQPDKPLLPRDNNVMIFGDGTHAGNPVSLGAIISNDTPGDTARLSQQYLKGLDVSFNNLFVSASGNTSPQQVNNELQGINAENASLLIQVPKDPHFSLQSYQQALTGEGGALHGKHGALMITDGEHILAPDGKIITASYHIGNDLANAGVQQAMQAESTSPWNGNLTLTLPARPAQAVPAGRGA